MLNCTLNTEQYSCPFFILFTLYPTSRSHIQTTHTPAWPAFKEFGPLRSRLVNAWSNTLMSCVNSVYECRSRVSIFLPDVLYPFSTLRSTQVCHQPEFSCCNSSCLCYATFPVYLASTLQCEHGNDWPLIPTWAQCCQHSKLIFKTIKLLLHLFFFVCLFLLLVFKSIIPLNPEHFLSFKWSCKIVEMTFIYHSIF